MASVTMVDATQGENSNANQDERAIVDPWG